MKFLVLFACIAAVSATNYFRDDLLVLDYEKYINPNPLIVGGSEVSIATRPFQLSLRQNGNHICGASIISGTWALSAAHCYPANPALAAFTFRAGSTSRLTGGVIFNSAQIVRHPQYSGTTLNNDVAVHRITGSFGGTNQATIALATRLSTVAGGTSSVVSGWGLTSPGGALSTNLRAVTIPIVASATCANTWSITDK
jgi:trypsin